MPKDLGITLDRLWSCYSSLGAVLIRKARIQHGCSLCAHLKIAQKLGEEAVEAVIEGVRGDWQSSSARAPISSIT